jgi:hypothetical protein
MAKTPLLTQFDFLRAELWCRVYATFEHNAGRPAAETAADNALEDFDERFEAAERLDLPMKGPV